MNPPDDPSARIDPPADTPATAHSTGSAWDCHLCGLSALQVNLLQLTASGHTDAEIQERYSLTSDALRRELVAAQRRLGARTKLHAVVKAFRGGWIS